MAGRFSDLAVASTNHRKTQASSAASGGAYVLRRLTPSQTPKVQLMQVLAYLLARFSEPSSYAGLGAMLALLGWNLPEMVLGQLIQALAAACALAALVLKERGVVPAIALVIAAAPMLST